MEQAAHPFEVTIYREQDLVGNSEARYLGMLGIVLDEDPATYPVRTRLNLEIRLKCGGRTWRCRMPAIVSRHSPLGLGLTFQPRDPRVLTALGSLIACGRGVVRSTPAPVC